ncbi:hypothetical protein JCM14076_15090 [Methylosoma difficile]
MIKHTFRGISLALFLLFSQTSLADVFKCVDSNGVVSYVDHVCEKGATSTLVEKSSQKQKALAAIKAPLPKLDISGLSINTQRLLAACYLIMSVLCFFFYFLDKQNAETGGFRTPESSLHLLELLGGWPGGLLAQRLLRHKNRKTSYQIVFWLIAGLHIVFWIDYLILNRSLSDAIKNYLATMTIA